MNTSNNLKGLFLLVTAQEDMVRRDNICDGTDPGYERVRE